MKIFLLTQHSALSTFKLEEFTPHLDRQIAIHSAVVAPFEFLLGKGVRLDQHCSAAREIVVDRGECKFRTFVLHDRSLPETSTPLVLVLHRLPPFQSSGCLARLHRPQTAV